MTALGTLTLAAALSVSADPCREDQPGLTSAAPDREAAAAYRAVGDEARAAGDLATARVAYREALRNEPGEEATTRALRQACQDTIAAAPTASASASAAASPDANRFSEGIALFEKGDRAGAIAAFERARGAGEDPAAALLEGVCQFELGHDAQARPLLLIARRDPAVSPTAAFFLGMLALREGEVERATALLADAASGDPRLARNAVMLSTLARKGGRLVLSALSEVGYDSNVELVPDGTVMPGSSADGSGVVAAGVTARLFKASGPYVRANGQYRRQFVISAYDLGQVGGGVGGRLAGPTAELFAEYGYDFFALGDAPYLSAHRLLARAHASRGAFTAGGGYAARLETYLTTATEPYSGLRQEADMHLMARMGRIVTLGLGYRGDRDATRANPELSYLEHGPVGLLQLLPSTTVRVLFEGRVSLRRYDTIDLVLVQRRADQYFDGQAIAEIDLSRSWTARVTAAARRALSNVAELSYTKLVTAAGFVYTFGAL